MFALETLIVRPVEPNVLVRPRLQGSHTVDTDAFDNHVGYVFLQKQPGATTDHMEHGQVS